MKKLFLILLVIVMTLSVVACGGQQNAAENTKGEGLNKVEAKDKGAPKSEAVNVKIPDGFREDLIPIFKGSVILEAQKDDLRSQYTSNLVVAYTDKDFDKVVAFYKGIATKFQIKDEQEEKGFQFLSVQIDEKHSAEMFVQDLEGELDDDIPKDAKTLFHLDFRQWK